MTERTEEGWILVGDEAWTPEEWTAHQRGLRNPTHDANGLTARQLEVMRVYAQQGSTARTAHALGTREQTVKNQLQTVRSRLGVHTTLDALRRLGWLEVPE